jgi:hypothetical protein
MRAFAVAVEVLVLTAPLAADDLAQLKFSVPVVARSPAIADDMTATC